MDKSVRLNEMILFLNDKHFFNLKDLMQEFGISKSTALRDVQALEAIGLPLYSEAGRNGRYRLIKQRLLAPILFTEDELSALYFAMLTLQAYETTPFHLSIAKLKQKFATCLSKKLTATLERMEQVLKLEGTKHGHSSPFLKEIVQAAVTEQVCIVTYQKAGEVRQFSFQFLTISASFGQWYATGFNYQRNQIQVVRCDRITAVSKDDRRQLKPRKELIALLKTNFRTGPVTAFEVTIAASGADLFYKENYPSMEMIKKDDHYVIRGFYRKGEERFIADYLIAYGQTIQAVQPIALKTLLQERMSELIQHYNHL